MVLLSVEMNLLNTIDMQDMKKFTRDSIKKSVKSLPPKLIPEQEASLQMMTSVDVARKYPRNLQVVTDNCLAGIDINTASKCFYIINDPGNEKVMIPTIYLAKLISQSYHNLRIESRVREQRRQFITSDCVIIDLESMLIIKSEGVQAIYNADKTKSFDQMIIEAGNFATAKATRKAILSIVPASLIDTLLKTASDILTGDISTTEKLISKRDELIQVFASYGISDTKISEYFKKDIFLFNKFDIIEMISLINQIADSEISVDELFGIKQESKEGINDIKESYAQNPDNH
jgi:hypothetical protein